MRDLAREEDEEEEEARCFTASQEECSKEGLVYVAGYLCHKLAHKYEWMGARTCHVPESNAPDFDSKWIRMISRGGLYLPSAELKQLVDSMETDFQKYHGPSLSLEKHSMNILAKILQLKNPGVPLDLLQLFSRARFYMRLKYLNKELHVHEKSIQRRYTIHVNKFVWLFIL